MQTKDSSLLHTLFQDDSYWRDWVALTWDFRQAWGREEFKNLLWSVVDDIEPSHLRLAEDWPTPTLLAAGGVPSLVEIFFTFDTKRGQATGLLRGIPDDASTYGFRGYKLFTRLDSLRGFEVPPPFEPGRGFEPIDESENWLEARERTRAFADRDPQVLIVGGGHSGMMAAAHFERLGVDALIVDKNERVGDNWRKRYHNLALHTPSDMAQMPYLRYPDNFPQYIPKDRLANWFETYAENLDLNFWTSTEFLGGDYDVTTKRWTVTVRRADGTERVLRPQHLILATGGVGGYPNIPEVPGIENFSGDVMHSSKFTSGEQYAGKNAIVLGVGTSAHDIARDLYDAGAKVTMVQRRPVAVVSIDSANAAYSDFFNGTPDVLVDIRFAADAVLPLLKEALVGYQGAVAEWDHDLHQALEAAGMRIEDPRAGDRSWLLKYYENGGGYYLNIGTSDIIAAGGIGVIQSADVETYAAEGAKLVTGETLAADVVVMATGYQGRHTELARYFGDEVMNRVGPVGRGFDSDGEWTNVWKRTPQPGLWFMLGGINNARPASWPMALMIKAELEGLVPEEYLERVQGREVEVSTAS